MRNLIFLRGIMGSGKSTFLRENNLEDWTISSDKIRLLFQSPYYDINGKLIISKGLNTEVFKIIRYLTEERMKNRELIIIDATNIDLNRLKEYKSLCFKYGYVAYILDFSDISLETALIRNKNRNYEVPKKVLVKAYNKLKEDTRIPNWINVIKPNDLSSIDYKIKDFSSWKKIHHIGDLHGCYTVLREYLNNDSLKEDELYIFTGDFIDRGIEHKELLNMLLAIVKRPNVIMLEGNHDINIFNYANGISGTKYFENNTKKYLYCFDKKKLRNFYRKLKPFVYYKYDEKEVLVSHGGLTFLPKKFYLIPENQFIRGIGDYELNVGELWDSRTKENVYQLHGHRNANKYPINYGTRTFVLEGGVEIGGYLRTLTLSHNEGFKEYYIRNESK